MLLHHQGRIAGEIGRSRGEYMTTNKGLGELRGAMGRCRWHFLSVAVFSIFVNLLMLTGPLFMLQIRQ